MREYCELAEMYLSEMPAFELAECGYLPLDACDCLECPYYKLVNSPSSDGENK